MRATIEKTLHSGGLAKATGVSPDTIRHYEKIGVLPSASRTESGYRLYRESAVERVLVVQRALRIGFTLAELAEVLKARDAGGAPCQRVYKLAKDKLKGIRGDIEALKRTERYLKQVLSDWEDRIQRASPGTKSNLLHSLTGPIRGSSARRISFGGEQHENNDRTVSTVGGAIGGTRHAAVLPNAQRTHEGTASGRC